MDDYYSKELTYLFYFKDMMWFLIRCPSSAVEDCFLVGIIKLK